MKKMLYIIMFITMFILFIVLMHSVLAINIVEFEDNIIMSKDDVHSSYMIISDIDETIEISSSNTYVIFEGSTSINVFDLKNVYQDYYYFEFEVNSSNLDVGLYESNIIISTSDESLTETIDVYVENKFITNLHDILSDSYMFRGTYITTIEILFSIVITICLLICIVLFFDLWD